MTTSWKDRTLVAFDTETSGAYPVNDDIVEIGAVKWRNGQIIEEYQTLVKPRRLMGDAVIKIHGITNEMVANSETIDQVLPKFHAFIGDAVVIAHHAPFDLGFLTYEFERLNLPLPPGETLCSSLLARALIGEAPNHRLQTLAGILNIPPGKAHRALDDAKVCLSVTLECLKRIGETASIADVAMKMGKPLAWSNYVIRNSGDEKLIRVCDAILEKKDLQIMYEGGSLKGIARRLTPTGLVRNPDGDFIYGHCHIDGHSKRFYMNRISQLDVVINPQTSFFD